MGYLLLLLLQITYAEKPIKGSGYFPPPGGSTLLSGLVSYWALNESSGTRSDSVGSNHLSDVNTVGSEVDATFGTVAVFNKTAQEYLDLGTSLPKDLGGFTIAYWIKFDADGTSPQGWIGNGGFLYNNESSYIFEDQNVGLGQFVVLMSDTTVDFAQTSEYIASSASWHLHIGWYDATDGKVRHQVDQTTVQVSSGSVADFTIPLVTTASRRFTIGSYRPESTYFKGRMSRVGYWSRVLTADERACLYHSGTPINYPFTGICQ